MAAVTAAMIKSLRDATNAGMSACKNALVEADGDFDKAVDVLRERGLAAAAKKAGRIAAEGLVSSYVAPDSKTGVIIEINSETDFVSKNSDFRAYVAQVVGQAIRTDSADIASFLEDKWHIDESMTVKEALTQKIAVTGERLDIRRFEKYEAQDNGLLVNYVHGAASISDDMFAGRVAVLLEIAGDSPNLLEAGKNICLQIASMSPKFVSRDDISADFIEKEREILTQQAKLEESENAAKNPKYRSKPDKVLQNIINGRLEKEMKVFCLAEQEYVKDGDLNVSQYLQSVGKDVAVKRFVRYETGEGLEKRSEDFAAEVNKAIQG
ncbi:MAG: translation elongation factor Ts [Clostridiales bacterium]|jgi:elongation factor Ts|nr:translation elongation factor Ts [Clostridiales bacterium]